MPKSKQTTIGDHFLKIPMAGRGYYEQEDEGYDDQYEDEPLRNEYDEPPRRPQPPNKRRRPRDEAAVPAKQKKKRRSDDVKEARKSSYVFVLPITIGHGTSISATA